MDDLGRPLGAVLIAAGILLVLGGAWMLWGPPLPWLGRLPGDVRIERPGLRIHLPITTSILLSVVLSLLLYLFSRLR